ncbi:hypothetical protein DFQ30_001944 [Apophysomyces sp. BC1015]|nr:hypothetical protein DFQ30_001944 [Apophysomyces sp. BC1015]
METILKKLEDLTLAFNKQSETIRTLVKTVEEQSETNKTLAKTVEELTQTNQKLVSRMDKLVDKNKTIRKDVEEVYETNMAILASAEEAVERKRGDSPWVMEANRFKFTGQDLIPCEKRTSSVRREDLNKFIDDLAKADGADCETYRSIVTDCTNLVVSQMCHAVNERLHMNLGEYSMWKDVSKTERCIAIERLEYMLSFFGVNFCRAVNNWASTAQLRLVWQYRYSRQRLQWAPVKFTPDFVQSPMISRFLRGHSSFKILTGT